MNATNPNQELAQYLHKRLEYLEECTSAFNSHLDEGEQELQRKIKQGIVQADDSVVGEIRFHHRYVLANTFRYTMLVGLCSFLEEAIKKITQRIVSNYETNIKAVKKGNWLQRHRLVLAKHSGVDLGPIIEDMSTFQYLITMRNCVVHAWGKVEGARDPKAVKEAVAQIDTVEVTANGFLYFGDQVLPAAVIAAERIADHISDSELKTSIT